MIASSPLFTSYNALLQEETFTVKQTSENTHGVKFFAGVRQKRNKKRLVATTILRGLQNKYIRGFRQ